MKPVSLLGPPPKHDPSNFHRVVECPVCHILYKGFFPDSVLERCKGCGTRIVVKKAQR